MSRRILIDAYWLIDGPPSGRNVVFGLSSAWASTFPQDTVDLGYPRTLPEPAAPLGTGLRPIKATARNHGAWALVGIGRGTKGYDAVLTQNFTPLLGSHGARRATFFHDALFKEHPHWFTAAERAYLAFASGSLGRANTVLTSSDTERRRIERVIPRTKNKVKSVGLAVPTSLAAAAESPEGARRPRPFILTVGRLNVRKNLLQLIRAYADSGLSASHDLLIVGSPDGRRDRLSQVDGVTFLGPVDDAMLAGLYRRCDFFVFPSLDEGFGLPLIEAAHFGAPAVASNISPFSEIGTADVHFDPRSTSSIAAALRKMAETYARSARTDPVAPFPSDWASVVRRARQAIFE